MIKMWNTVTREDVMTEVITGVWTLDEKVAERLDWTSYLSHMHELMLDGTNKNEQAVREHFDDLTFMIFGERTNLELGRFPSETEGMMYRNHLHTRKLIDELTATTMSLTQGNWPSYKKHVCDHYGIDLKEFEEAFE